MPDDIQRTIYKLEIDDSGYIRGIESLNNSTKKLTAEQERTNQVLKTNEAALKTQSEFLQQTKKDLDSYTGTNERYRQQLQKSFKDAQADNIKLTETVNNNRKAYELAQKAAQDFANISARATTLQQGTTGGKIPTGPPPGISSPITSVEGLPQAIIQSKEEFDQLAFAIAAAEEEMKSLDATSDEFKLLAPIVEKGKEALQHYDAAAEQASGSTLSLRTQITKGREELVRLEEAGKGTSKEYITLLKNVAKLTDAFNDQQARIKILASDTKLLDFGKSAIIAATSAFQAFTSISILAGDESAELQKKTMQLFAAMQLLQSLEQLSNLTRRESTLATLAQSGAQAVYTAVVGTTTGALRAFRIAMLATGIGAAVVLIGFLVAKFQQLRNAQREANAEAKLTKEINDKAIDSYSGQVTQIDIIRRKLTDLSIPQKDRIAFAKEYNKTADEGNKIDLTQINNIDLLNAAITRQIAKIKERATAQASANVTAEKATVLFKAQAALAEQIPEFDLQLENIEGDLNTARNNILKSKKTADIVKAELLVSLLEDIRDAKEDFDRAANLAASVTTTAIVAPEKEKKTAIDNIFEEEKARLLARMAELRNSTEENIKKINEEFAAKLLVEKNRIEKLLKDKKLLGSISDEKSQAGILFKLSTQINQTELNKALEDFSKKITDARKKLNDELNDLDEKNVQDNLNLIRDEFDRRAALIDFNEKKELSNAEENNQKRLDALDFQRLLIGEQAYQDAKARIISAGELQALNIIREKAQERQALAADSFKNLLDAFQGGLNQGLIARDEELAKLIRAASDKFLTGKITFEQFEKELTAIQKNEEGIRRDATLENQRSELAALDRQIESTIDKTTKEYKDLLKLRDDFNKKIAEGEKEDAIKDAQDVGAPDTTEDPRVEKIIKFSEAVGSITQSIISFWQKANEAESAALDKSIALQEKRVDAAQRIAERGNAQYLKQEQDRLTQLNVQRENAARRQLAIDAALQASQVLVAITGAITHLANPIPGAGIAETLAQIAIIVGALATGYGLVKSLQGNQPKFKEGTKYVKRDGHPSGTDTIPAWLTEGEAVIPQDKNKKYKKSVEAIYHGKVPAKVLNEFVENYVRSDKKINKQENIISTVNKVANEISDKKFTSKEVKILIENKTSDTVNVIHTLVDEKIKHNEITSDIQNSLVIKNVSFTQIQKFSEVINKITNIEIYKKFVENISKIPGKILTAFIENYHTKEHTITKVESYFRGTPDLKGAKGVDKIPVWATQGEAIIPVEKNNLYKPVINAIFEGKIPAERLNSFVNTYHTIKSVPQVDYNRIKDAAELKITSDGKMSVLLTEHSNLLRENNDLQRQILKKKILVEQRIDRNGVAAMVTDYMTQKEIDRHS